MQIALCKSLQSHLKHFISFMWVKPPGSQLLCWCLEGAAFQSLVFQRVLSKDFPRIVSDIQSHIGDFSTQAGDWTHSMQCFQQDGLCHWWGQGLTVYSLPWRCEAWGLLLQICTEPPSTPRHNLLLFCDVWQAQTAPRDQNTATSPSSRSSPGLCCFLYAGPQLTAKILRLTVLTPSWWESVTSFG